MLFRSVELDSPEAEPERVRALFEAAYHRRFHVALEGMRAMVVNANCSVIGVRPPLDLSTLIDPAGRAASLAEAQTGTRPVRFDARTVETPVYWRDRLPATARLDGPALVEQRDTTILLEPGCRAEGDGQGNLIVEVAP